MTVAPASAPRSRAQTLVRWLLVTALAFSSGRFLLLIAHAVWFPDERELGDVVFLQTSLWFWPIPGLAAALLASFAFPRRGAYPAFMAAMFLTPVFTCVFPYPLFYWRVVDPIANQRELKIRSAALQPVVAALARCLGEPPIQSGDPSACLNKIWPRLLPGRGRNLWQLQLFAVPEGFAVSAWATPGNREPGIGSVGYSSLDGEWRWGSTESVNAIRRLARDTREADGWDCRFDKLWACTQPALR